ncbi:GNAT family N-acetyltransferase [Pseudoduganella sp. LjRoot289]|uniref:GNAT family N-acetyltransferase n=1 Tax=Pseudoduganella sp. LjRoot289 TaxID=3342314 RepID=UPI003ECC39B8
MAYTISPLNATHDVSAFDCGIAALNTWLQEMAGQHMRKRISRTYVLLDDAAPAEVLGFYALAIRSMTPNDALPVAYARKLPRDVPGYTLARLAIRTDMQGQCLGVDLLMNAMDRVRAAAEQVAGYAFFVDAKDDAAAAFYARYGFMPLPSNPRTLFMPIANFAA